MNIFEILIISKIAVFTINLYISLAYNNTRQVEYVMLSKITHILKLYGMRQ